jgi:aspartate/methionine/tyrosine aminotransferase
MNINKQLFAIPEIFTKVFTEAIKETSDVINLARGDSEFATPRPVTEYLSSIFLDDGDYKRDINSPIGRWTHYEKELGSVHLRKSIAQKYQDESNLNIGTNNILVTQGGMNAIFYACYSLLLPGDEIIICDPAYIAYEPICGYIIRDVKVRRLTLVYEENYNINYERLRNLISDSTKAIIITSPYNPCGRVYAHEQLFELMEFCRKKGIFVIHDENHEKEIYDGHTHYPISIFDNNFSHSILLNSFSRLGMGGWRVGWMIANEQVITAAQRLHAFVNMTCNTFVQEAAAYALDNYSKLGLQEKFLGYKNKRDKLVDFFSDVQGIDCIVPEGTCYMFPDISQYYNNNRENIEKSVKNSEWFLSLSKEKQIQEAKMMSKRKSYSIYLYFLVYLKVGILPGCCYGENSDNNIRISFSVRDEAINEAIIRMRKLVKVGV